jgi:hypothetical protein
MRLFLPNVQRASSPYNAHHHHTTRIITIQRASSPYNAHHHHTEFSDAVTDTALYEVREVYRSRDGRYFA